MKRITTTLLLAALLVIGGCLEIDGQDVHFRYDPAADRIDVMLVHRGLFAEGGNGSSSDPLDKALKDLAEARKTGEFVFWNNWPLSVNPSGDYEGPRKALLAHIEVENGDLFTDPQGVLCAYQFVRVHKVKSFLSKVNTVLELAIQQGFSGGIPNLGDHKLDDDTRDILRDFLRSGEKMLRIEKGRIELRLPFSQRDHTWFKSAIYEHMMKNLPREIIKKQVVAERRKDGGAPTDTSAADEGATIHGAVLRREIEHAPSFRFFWDNEITIQRAEELTTIGLGFVGADELHIRKARGGLYHDAMLNKLREQQQKIEEGLPDQELTRRFEDFRKRDAKLPETLAAKRG